MLVPQATPDSLSTLSRFVFNNLNFAESIKLYNQTRETAAIFEDLKRLVDEQSSIIESLDTPIHQTRHFSQATVPERKKCIVS
jgi:hypothetical protein